jgi:hypothetical protein
MKIQLTPVRASIDWYLALLVTAFLLSRRLKFRRTCAR